MIFNSIEELQKELMYFRGDLIYCTSCPGDPLHEGHIECLNACGEMSNHQNCKFVVIVNSDEFLIRKKGYCLLPLKTRMAVINNLKCNPWVVPWDDGTQNVAGALKIIKPCTFCKGGDRTAETMDKEELKVCNEIHCQIKYGVGGYDKKASSSDFVKNAIKQLQGNTQIYRNCVVYNNPSHLS